MFVGVFCLFVQIFVTFEEMHLTLFIPQVKLLPYNWPDIENIQVEYTCVPIVH